MLECEGIGKNIEQAIQNALLELKAPREDVDIKIISEGGFLKKAKVLVSISEDAREKYEKRDERRKEIEKIEVEEEKADADFAESFMAKKIATTKEESKTEEVSTPKVRIIADEEISDKIKDEEVTVERKERISAEEFLSGILDAMDLEAEIERTEDDKFVTYNLKGENLNDLIGHHGECMLALNQIMALVCKSEDHKRVLLDVEGYRIKRKESLTALAKRVADKVAKSGRYYKLEPMDASERKIIHTALQDDDRVTTLSKGEEPHRYLIVFPKEYRD